MTCKFYFILSALLLMFPKNIVSQETDLAKQDEILFDKYVEHISQYKTKTMEKTLEKTAEFFLNTPYVAHTLDQNEDERLVVNFRGLDCVTFVENVLALSLVTHNNELSMDCFRDILIRIRYRNNEVSDYASRIHYTSDWIYENQQQKLIENISNQLSGKKETKQINFMSSHRNAYNKLKKDDAMLGKIVDIENTINERGGFYYLPKEMIAAKADDIPHMAIIGFVTTIDGLDTSHVGFAYRKNGKLKFIHASLIKKKVVIDEQALSDYCNSQKRCKGIIVAKVL